MRYKRTKARCSSYKGEIAPAAPDLVKRFSHTATGAVVITDVTEMAADDGKVYLSALGLTALILRWAGAVGCNPNQ